MINNNVKKIIIALIVTTLIVACSKVEAVIITGEQSQDNDEYDQQMTVDGVSEEGTKFAERLTSDTEEGQESEKNEKYDLVTKIDNELKKQLEEDMAESVKYEIDYAIYKNEDDLETNIRNIWKESSNNEISYQNLQNIMNVAKNTLTNYGHEKVDLWFSQYYKNNKDIIINKIKEFVGTDGTDEEIQSGIGIVLYTATSPLEDEVKNIAEEIINSIPNTVKEKVNAQKKFSAWESKATSVICSQITIDIQNKLQEAFKEDFNWQSEKLYESFRDIGSYSSDVADQFTEEVKNNLKDSIMNQLGYTSNLSIEELLLQYLISQSDSTLGAQIKLVTGIVEDKELTPEKVQQYYKDYEKILAQKEEKAKKEHTTKVNDANKKTDTNERKKLIAEANDWLNEKKEEIKKEADAEAREKLKNEVYDQYKEKIQDIETQVRNDAADTINRETNDLLRGILSQANITFEDIDFVSMITNKNNSELDDQESAEKEQLKIDNGLKLSKDQINKRAQELDDAKTKRDQDLEKIDEKYGQTLEPGYKEKKKEETDKANSEHENNKSNIEMTYGQKLTPQQEAAKKAADDAVNKEANKKIESEKNKNKALSDEIDKTKQEIEDAKKQRDEDYKNEIYDINFDYGQIITDEDKQTKAKVKQVIEDDYDQQKKDTKVEYGRVLSDERQKEKDARKENNQILKNTNLENIQIKYGLQLSPEVQAEKDSKINEISSSCMKELEKYKTTPDMSWWEANQMIDAGNELLRKANAQIEAINNDPKYSTKKETDLDATQLRNYRSETNAEKNRFKSEEQAIENEFALTPKDTVNGVSYDDAMDKINSNKKKELEALDDYYSKEKLEGTKKVEYEAALAQAEKNKQAKNTEIKGQEANLKTLKEKNKEVEKNIENIEKERKTKLEENAKNPEYKTRDFKDKEEEAAFKAAIALENQRHNEQIKEIDKKYKKKELTPEEKVQWKAEREAANQNFKINTKAIREKYKVKDFDELSKENQEKYLQQEKAITEKYAEKRKAELQKVNDEKKQYKAKLQLAEIACEEALDQRRAKYNFDKTELEAQYANGQITKEEYNKRKKELNEKFVKDKEAIIAQKQKILDTERQNWAKEKQLLYQFSSQFVMKAASDAVGKLTDGINSSIAEWSEKLGAIGSGLVKGVTSQLVNHYGQELVKNIGYLWNNLWGQNAQMYGFKGFKLDWGSLALTVLFSWASSNEFLASVLSGVGRIYPT